MLAIPRLVSLLLWIWVLGVFASYTHQYIDLLPAIANKLGLVL
jgi:hypothetical protein